MIVERFGNGRVLGSSLTGLAFVLSSSVVLGQQPQPSPQQQAQPSPQSQQPQAQQSESQSQRQRQQQQQAQQQPAGRQQRQQAAEQDVEVAAAAPAGQQAQPMWTGVRVIEVKHDRIAEFEALMKELATAVQEAGQPGFEVFMTELGELGTYHIVSPFESFSSIATETPPMEPTEWANWLNRIQATIDDHRMAVAQLRPDLSILPPEGQQSQQTPELMLLITDKVMAGKTQEFETHLREEIVPALRQSDITGFFANAMTFGSDGRTWVFAVPLEGWERLDQPSPFVEVLGPEAAQELMLRGDQLVENSDMVVLRYREDLSTQPPQ